jgi:hypothetical protein
MLFSPTPTSSSDCARKDGKFCLANDKMIVEIHFSFQNCSRIEKSLPGAKVTDVLSTPPSKRVKIGKFSK